MHNALKTNNWLWIQTDLGINYYVGVFQTRPFYQAVLLRPTLTTLPSTLHALRILSKLKTWSPSATAAGKCQV
jgi:hypothetical protein